MKTMQMGGYSPASATLIVVSQKSNTERNSARVAYAAFTLVSGVLMGALHVRVEGLLVPSYIYLAGTGATQWSALATAVTSISTVVILSSNSGPGTTQDTGYVAAVAKVYVAGGKVIGYVSSLYANRLLSVVVQDISTYQVLYQVDGFFIDEMTADGTTAHMQLYQSIYNYIKGLSPNYIITGNPGTNVPEVYANLSVADQLAVFRDSARYYAGYASLAWQANYPTARLAHITYATSAAQMQTFVRNASDKGVATALIASKTLSNLHGVPPTYWSREVSATAVTP